MDAGTRGHDPRRDGSTGIYRVVEKPDFVVIVPVEDDGQVHLVEQYRYPVKGRYWELPEGSWEQEQGADPMEMARGELLEETGLEKGTGSQPPALLAFCLP